MRDGSGVADLMVAEGGFARPTQDVARVTGRVVYELFGACPHLGRPGLLAGADCLAGRCPDMPLKQRGEVPNLVTQIGDQYLGERATGIGSPPGQVTRGGSPGRARSRPRPRATST